MSFEERLNDLHMKANSEILRLIEEHGEESELLDQQCLKVTDEDFQYNLEGRRYLVEVHYIELVDNKGYTYDHEILGPGFFFMVIDYLIKKYENK